MKTIKILITALALVGSGFTVLLDAQEPVPYPDVPTSETKVETKDVDVASSSSSSSSADDGTQKGLVSMNTGKTGIIGIGSMNVKFEGKSVIRHSDLMQFQSQSGSGIDCQKFPNHCNEVVYEFMKKQLPPAKLRRVGNKSIEEASMASKSTMNDFRKKVRSDGLWVRLHSGRWIRIDKNIPLTKAVINQLWRKGK